MDLELAGQVAIIVGGANGIGRAIANGFAGEGASVVIADIDPASPGVAVEIAAATGSPASAIIVDTTDLKAIQDAAGHILEEHPAWQHVIYASGIGSGKYGYPFWNLNPEDWQSVIDVNLLGAVNVAHTLATELVKNQGGTLLFLSSVAGQIGSQTDPPYSAAKAAIINFAQCAAKDLAPYNVRVNVICPGMVKTSLNESVWRAWHNNSGENNHLSYEQWAEEKIRRICPLGRWQTCQDIANLAVFLASTRAANITGQTLNVDGGQVMQ